jgi:hypothetical protein
LDDHPKEPLKVLDRRKFTADGDRREGIDFSPPEAAPPRDPAPEAAQNPAEGAASKPAGGKPGGESLPTVNQAFALLVQELAQSCAIALGVPDPVSGLAKVDLQAANLYIDFLEALQEKTSGNLAPQEKKLLNEGLFQLKMLYAQAGPKPPQ